MAQGTRERPEHTYLGSDLLGLDSSGTGDLVRRVLEGLPYSAMESFRERVEMSAGEMAQLVGINPRTMSRRKIEGRLTSDESDRVLRLSGVYASALGLFDGDLEKAKRWLSTPKVALGGETPFEYSRVDVGAQEVIDLVGRIEHGVTS